MQDAIAVIHVAQGVVCIVYKRHEERMNESGKKERNEKRWKGRRKERRCKK
jgi:hypothetical protein